jgi:hypothetical protein
LEKFPFASVVPIGVFENEPEGMEPDTVTGELGVAPVIATIQVSPTCIAVPPREVVKVSFPPTAAGAFGATDPVYGCALPWGTPQFIGPDPPPYASAPEYAASHLASAAARASGVFAFAAFDWH